VRQKKITKLARGLRKSHTDAELLLWKYLRTRQMDGVKFRRQQPIGKYIVDFVSFEKRIVIEVDGGQHSEEVDKERDQWLNNEGFKVLRFWNNEVLKNIEGVFELIRDRCLSTLP
jgi:very-short-patch-repair endonuclease